ncbi:MAG: two-component sensor histidine kinase [Micrococcales bacterium 70-64]|nr:HAMP domain-containing histidine kinase [Leifsonia sp.]ODU63930.1 MAG: two-component sensor histidine kinase [Leifsonia sp. SCN 70-46]OJX85621.1 MAG: two-component sensor histidine kinase [Micrococcales bacterium 70-64]
MRLGRPSIRARITLGSIAVAAVLLVAALFLVRAQFAAILSAADSTLAQSDLTSFQQDIRANPEEAVDDPGTGILVYVQAPDGTVEVDTVPHDVLAVVRDRAAGDEEFAFTDDEGRTFLVVGRSVDTPQGTWALWSARSTSSSEIALEGLDRVLVIGGVVLLLGFAVASWLLATAALRPVTAMRRQAERLEADGHLPVPQTRDELAELATTLNRFLEQVQAANLREKQMVSDAAHELRTPLAALKTQLELAHRDDGDAAALGRQLRAAEGSVDRLSSLASNLLELSRLESHDATASSDAASVIDEFTGSVDRARTLAIGRGIAIDFDVRVGDESARYALDAQAFGRLCDNLLSNALNALPPTGTIVATLAQLGESLTLTVQDDGPGMPDDFVPLAFERFSRPDASRATSTGGSGLGLALVHALAVGAGGTASVENTRPGLLVTVSLPKM